MSLAPCPLFSYLDLAPRVTLWGTGTPKWEFLYSEDMADACVFLMNLSDSEFARLLSPVSNLAPCTLSLESISSLEPASNLAPLVNIGVGEDVTIKELAETVKQVVGFTGEIVFDTSKPDGTPRKLMDVSASMRWDGSAPCR